MKNRLENPFNTCSNVYFPTNHLPLLEGICIQRGDAWSWMFTISGQRDSETSCRTSGTEGIRLIQGTFLLFHTRQ